MQDLKITDLDLFFVVKPGDGDALESIYDFVGMAYSIDSARELARDGGEILKLDMMKMVPLAKQMGYVKEVS
jgi:hypothetical protein